MLKKAMIPLMVVGFVVGMQADNFDMETLPSKVFLGVQFSGARVQGDHLLDKDYATGGFAYGLRLGAENNDWRTLVSVDKFDNNESSYKRLELHAQYLFTLPQLTDIGICPFIGLNGGYANYKAKGPDKDGKKIDESGFTYGAETGVVYGVNDMIDVDLTYQYTMSSAEAFDHVGTLTLGINYKY